MRTDAQRNLKFAFNLLDAVIDGKAGNKTIGVVYNDSFMGESTFIPASLVLDADEKGDYRRFSGQKDVDVLNEADAREFIASDSIINLLTISDIPSFPIDCIDISKIDALKYIFSLPEKSG